MTYDPANLAEAAETLRHDLIVAAGCELSRYVQQTSQAAPDELLDLFSDWGFDPLEWLQMTQDDRLQLISLQADAQRSRVP